MFQPLVLSDRYLGGQSFAAAKYRGTNHSRKSGVDEHLAAYHHEATVTLRICSRLVNAIKFASSHAGLFFFRRGLIIQHVGRFRVEPLGGAIDPFQIMRLDLRPRS